MRAAPVWVSEFGTSHDAGGVSSNWFVWLTQYLSGKNADLDWGYWALNGTESSGTSRTWGAVESYGILDASWSSPAYAPHLAALQALQPISQKP